MLASYAIIREGKAEFSLDAVRSGHGLSELMHKTAHEIGNPLTAIISLTSILERPVDIKELQDATGIDSEKLERELGKVSKHARWIQKDAWRVSTLVERLVLILSRREPNTAVCNLPKVLNRALGRLRSRFALGAVEVESYLHPNCPEVKADPDQITALLIELLLNALQAADIACAENPDLSSPIELRANTKETELELSLLNPIKQSCPFELSTLATPYVTEFSEHKQLGLGLTTVAAVLERLGGSLSFREREKDGKIYFESLVALPLANPVKIDSPKQELPEDRSLPSLVSALAERSGDTFSVLLIENEDTIASAIEKILSVTIGKETELNVEKARGGEVASFFRGGNRFDAILCDLRLEDSTGQIVFESLLKHFPDQAQRVAFLMGNRGARSLPEFVQAAGRPVLIKPFGPEALLEILLAVAKDKS